MDILTLMPLVLLIVIMYFLLIRPQKKREKAINEMRGAVKVGDDIITIGGIYGKVVKVRDEQLTIQVGSDKTKFEVTRWAISKVVNEQPEAKGSKAVPAKDEEEAAERPKRPKRMLKKDDGSEESNPAEEEAVTEIEEQAELEAADQSEAEGSEEGKDA